jgi:hypothetical protein
MSERLAEITFGCAGGSADAPDSVLLHFGDSGYRRYGRTLAPNEAMQLRDMREYLKTSETNAEHYLRLFKQSEEVVVDERSKTIIAYAQRDKAMAENQQVKAQLAGFKADNLKLQEAIKRQERFVESQVEMIADREKYTKELSVALANAQARIKYLQEELVRMAAEAKLAKVKSFAYPCPVEGDVWRFHPKRVAVDVHGIIDATYDFDAPIAVHLTF